MRAGWKEVYPSFNPFLPVISFHIADLSSTSMVPQLETASPSLLRAHITGIREARTEEMSPKPQGVAQQAYTVSQPTRRWLFNGPGYLEMLSEKSSNFFASRNGHNLKQHPKGY